MTASFPRDIANFTTKRNIFDDVDANDINRMQEEIIALETTLGAAINELNSVEAGLGALQEEVDLTEAELDELRQEEQTAESLTNIRFKNLNDKLDYIASGQHIHAASAQRVNVSVPSYPSNVNGGYGGTTVKLTRPMAKADPWRMYNGIGLTLKKSGFWTLQASGHFGVVTKNGNNNQGIYEIAVAVNGHIDWRASESRDMRDHTGAWQDIALSGIAIGWFEAGTRITLLVRQSSKIHQNLVRGDLHAVCHRSRALTSRWPSPGTVPGHGAVRVVQTPTVT